MEIVIEITNEEYEWIKRANRQTTPLNRFCVKAIANGTPLPKHHGDLVDRDELLDNSYEINSMFCLYDEVVNVDDIKDAPTIIEAADKEE